MYSSSAIHESRNLKQARLLSQDVDLLRISACYSPMGITLRKYHTPSEPVNLGKQISVKLPAYRVNI